MHESLAGNWFNWFKYLLISFCFLKLWRIIPTCMNVKWKVGRGVYGKRQRLTTDRKIGICIVRGLFMIREIGPSKTGHQAAFSKDCTKPKERWNKHGIPFFNSFFSVLGADRLNWSNLSLSLMMLAMKMVISEVARQLWCSCRVTNA